MQEFHVIRRGENNEASDRAKLALEHLCLKSQGVALGHSQYRPR